MPHLVTSTPYAYRGLGAVAVQSTPCREPARVSHRGPYNLEPLEDDW